MAKGCKKCDPHEICEECPEWIFTLADLIMCMMGLFVILWCLKKEGEPAIPKEAQQAIQQREEIFLRELGGAFGYQQDPSSSSRDSSPAMNGPGEKGDASSATESPEGRDRESTTIRIGRTATMGDYINFAAGVDELTPKGRAQLDKLAAKIKGHKQVVLVKGHASLDDLPQGSSKQQFMDLSTRRAQRAADYLMRVGVEPETLRVMGCSTFEPLVERRPAPEHAQNRRVEVEATPTLTSELQDPQGEAKPLPRK
jgi:outer membrane protein OmpA-like peptidoglycan-associated protein